MTAPALHADTLSKQYAIGGGWFGSPQTLKAVDGVSFTLHAGETLAVVGESGSGKSSLARLVTMIEPATSGRLEVNGTDIVSLQKSDAKALRQAVQIVFQNPYASLNPRQRIGSILAEPLHINTTDDPENQREQARAMLERVGLRPEHLDRYPHMFSGGQRQRIAIARALMLKPKILVLDEPVSALDISIQAQVLNLLVDLQRDFGLAYLFISHDLSVVRHMADQVLVLYLGRVMEQGSAAQVFESPQHPYTRALLSARPGVTADGEKRHKIRLIGEQPSPLNPPSGCVFRTRCPFANARCASEIPALTVSNSSAAVACHAVREQRLDYLRHDPDKS